ncbi:uncharacterized protein LOC101857196 isoform X2 [Aplysia californica]|uniref:Uncharacterized protein LOC101857196 isoform X2 n=1 Tax=Aplysia californica TaxID=6500 RepID=A0ABM0JYN5_APLCA|nr:uncharacterized protein LOC101857196 isoform X2 [Aplysia californica]
MVSLRLPYLLVLMTLVLVPALAQRLRSATAVRQPVDQKPLEPAACPLVDPIKEVEGYFDDTKFQLEGAQEKEVEMEEDEDEALQKDFVPPEDMPKERVSFEDLQKHFRLQYKTTLAEVNIYVAYAESQYLVSWRCCPRRQGYGCRSYRRRLPCFYDTSSNPPARCCPFYPSNAIYTAYCNCNKCAVLTENCASVGRCLRRYTLRSFYAVCSTNPWSVKRFTRRVATSCYCRTHC